MTSLLQLGQDPPLQIIYEDACIIAVNKPAGQLFQGHTKGLPSPLDVQVKAHIRAQKPGPDNVYLGIVHRLDRPVSGVVLFGLNSKFTGRLGTQFQEHTVTKQYTAYVEGTVQNDQGELVDELIDEGDTISKACRLTYEVLARRDKTTEVKILLGTGRRNQIRRQFSKMGHAIVGDTKFGATTMLHGLPVSDPLFVPIALHAQQITFLHPKTYESLLIQAPLPDYFQKQHLRT